MCRTCRRSPRRRAVAGASSFCNAIASDPTPATSMSRDARRCACASTSGAIPSAKTVHRGARARGSPSSSRGRQARIDDDRAWRRACWPRTATPPVQASSRRRSSRARPALNACVREGFSARVDRDRQALPARWRARRSRSATAVGVVGDPAARGCVDAPNCRTASRPIASTDHRARDHELLDLRRPFVDAEQADVAVEALDP